MTIVPTTGKGYLTSLIKLASRPGTEPNAIAMGTGTTAEAIGNTALTTEVESRTAGTSSQATTTETNDTYRVVGAITASAGRAVTEAGLFNSTTVAGSILVVRSMFSGSTINLASGDSIQFTWNIQLT